MTKREIVAQVLAEFRGQLDRAVSASRDARLEATDDESRAESKYDTHAIEASYLAAGQAERAEELALTIQAFRHTLFPEFKPGAPIAVGALVEVDYAGERVLYLISAAGGGTSCEVDGMELTVLAPSAPLAGKLMGAIAGTVLKSPRLKVVSVR